MTEERRGRPPSDHALREGDLPLDPRPIEYARPDGTSSLAFQVIHADEICDNALRASWPNNTEQPRDFRLKSPLPLSPEGHDQVRAAFNQVMLAAVRVNHLIDMHVSYNDMRVVGPAAATRCALIEVMQTMLRVQPQLDAALNEMKALVDELRAHPVRATEPIQLNRDNTKERHPNGVFTPTFTPDPSMLSRANGDTT